MTDWYFGREWTFRRGVVEYDGQMEPEMVELCDAMNSMYGITTRESCCGHGKEDVMVFFEVRDQLGLFFFARCIDRRYWKHGGDWSLSIEVGDIKQDDYLPVTYLLRSKHKGEEAYAEMENLIENIEQHLNHKNFIEIFKLDMSKFDMVPYVGEQDEAQG